LLHRSLLWDSVFCIQNAVADLQSIDSAPDLTEQVYSRLLRAICSGALQPGARLTQEDLAASLNVSRQPVLQALRLLKREGVVVDAGRRGLAVAPVDPELIANIYEVRGALEALAARLAAKSGRKIDPATLTRGRGALKTGDLAALIEADLAFHHALYDAAGTPLIAESADRHWHHVQRAMGASLQMSGIQQNVWNEHQAILEAVNAGDAARAERLARQHCEGAGRALQAALTASLASAS
jgi:DNA-binding GntR family transcriptional regulator